MDGGEGDQTLTDQSKKDLTDYLDEELSHHSQGILTRSSHGISDKTSEIYGIDSLFSNAKKKRRLRMPLS